MTTESKDDVVHFWYDDEEGPVEVVPSEPRSLPFHRYSTAPKSVWGQIKDYFRRLDLKALFLGLFPILTWLPKYEWRKNFVDDLVAGLTGGVMVIPQSMAYAMVASMPAHQGLYSSFVPPIIYAIFGSSRELSVGPVAIVSLLTDSAVRSAIGDPAADEDLTMRVGMFLAFLVGMIQLGMGLVRAGFFATFLSHPVLVGFTTAAAIVIGTTQLKHVFGVKMQSQDFVEALEEWGTELGDGKADGYTILFAACAILLLVAMKYLKKRKLKYIGGVLKFLPGALVAVVLGILIAYGIGEECTTSESGKRTCKAGGHISFVGNIPGDLPGAHDPLSAKHVELGPLITAAFIISLVGFVESMAVGKSIAEKAGYSTDANQELIGLGMANIIGSIFGAFPVTGGFSRSMVVAQAGAKSPLASVISGFVVLAMIGGLTSLVYYLPNAVLAAIVLVAVAGLIDIGEVRHILSIDPRDMLSLVFTFFVTLFAGIEIGIGVGVGISLLMILRANTYPHTAILGQLKGTNAYRNVSRNPHALIRDGILILRVDALLYFANIENVQGLVDGMVRRYKAFSGHEPVAFIFDASSVTSVDSTAATALCDTVKKLNARGIRFLLANVKGPVNDVLIRAGFDRVLAGQHENSALVGGRTSPFPLRAFSVDRQAEGVRRASRSGLSPQEFMAAQARSGYFMCISAAVTFAEDLCRLFLEKQRKETAAPSTGVVALSIKEAEKQEERQKQKQEDAEKPETRLLDLEPRAACTVPPGAFGAPEGFSFLAELPEEEEGLLSARTQAEAEEAEKEKEVEMATIVSPAAPDN